MLNPYHNCRRWILLNSLGIHGRLVPGALADTEIYWCSSPIVSPLYPPVSHLGIQITTDGNFNLWFVEFADGNPQIRRAGCIFTEELHVSGAMQFKPILFKDRLTPIYTWKTSQGEFQKFTKSHTAFQWQMKGFNSGVWIWNSFNLYALKSYNHLISSFQLFSRFYKWLTMVQWSLKKKDRYLITGRWQSLESNLSLFTSKENIISIKSPYV